MGGGPPPLNEPGLEARGTGGGTSPPPRPAPALELNEPGLFARDTSGGGPVAVTTGGERYETWPGPRSSP